MDDIAKHNGMSKKTIYQQVKDKEELVQQCLLAMLQAYQSEGEHIISKSENSLDKMIRLSANGLRHFAEINPSFIYDLHKYYKKSWATYEQFKKEFLVKDLMNYIHEGQNEGLITQDFHVESIVKIHLMAIDLVFDPMQFNPDKINTQEVLVGLFKTFVRGLLTAKGLKYFEKHISDQIEYNFLKQ